MDISNLLISIISLLAGIAATVFVSRYYFNRTTDKRLTPYLDFSTQLLRGIDPDVKKDLSISYQGVEVDDLLQVQYLIANTGERPIRDVIKPLKLSIPKEAHILDVSLLHVHPEGREVVLNVDEDKHSVEFVFPLLNSKEFFIAKLLIKGCPKRDEFSFSISVDDLPPTLEVERLPGDKIVTAKSKENRKFDKGEFIAGVVFLLLGAAPVFLTFQIDTPWPALSMDNISASLGQITWSHIAKILTWPTGISMGLIGVGLTMSSFQSIEFGKKHKYLVPDGLSRPQSIFFSPALLDSEPPEHVEKIISKLESQQ